ncbi:hypothetical protein, partial [Klebsiella pneumoniae]|uniref:hypothetical protein n=1 Tax=Klebsiella pneumoniae TaxID=573 RepID=UPI001A7E0740
LSGGRSLWKSAPAGRGLFALVLSFRYAYRYVICSSSSARRRLMTERSERMSEEAENHQNVQ